MSGLKNCIQICAIHKTEFETFGAVQTWSSGK